MQPKYILILICLLIAAPAMAQEPTRSQQKKAAPARTGSTTLEKIAKDIEEGQPQEVIAAGYEKLAKELSDKGDYTRAEDYLKRAQKIYETLKDKDKLAHIARELAKVQEAQNNLSDASANYDLAQSTAKDSRVQALNANDRNRLANKDNPLAQQRYIRENMELQAEMNNPEEQALSLKQMAETSQAMGNTEEAVQYLEEAAVRVETVNPAANFQIRQDIAKTLEADNQTEKALEINKELLAEAKKTENPKDEIKQLQNLSSNYFDAANKEEGIKALQQAYHIAVESGHTLAAKQSLQLLVEQYTKDRKPQLALEAYSDFMSRLDSLVRNDSTLIDEKFFQVQEEKILRLEKERELKDELIQKSNTINYVLIGTIVLILIFFALIARALYSIKKKNKRIALQSLRREMNPHFIFNSLNSVNQFIAQNNELEANKYLSSYSKLMRNMMENSNKDFIPLSVEMEQLREYLDLEYMRFGDKFKYIIEQDSSIDADATYIPNMLIQPQLENAIWHGLRYREGRGLLTLRIAPDGNNLSVAIEDNGIGLTKSKELKTKHQRQHNSRGLTNTHERIALLNSLYGTTISIDIHEKQGNESGVIVTLHFPLMDKNKMRE